MSKHIIWSDMNLDLSEWENDLLAENPDMTENEMYQEMVERNAEYLDDERANLGKHRTKNA